MRLHLLLTSLIFLTSCSNQSTEEVPPTVSPTRLSFEHGVRSILEDSKGNFWFGSHQEGVCRFDGQQFAYFTTSDGLSHNQIRTIQEDKKGIVWFETGNGISSYDGKQITTHSEKAYDSKDAWKNEASDLWFKGDEEVGINELEGQAGVYRYDGENISYLAFPFPEDSNGTNYYSISTGTVRGQSGNLWFGTYGAVIGYDGKSFTLINGESLGLNEKTGYLHVRSTLEDRNGNLWIGNNGIGVLLYDGETTINFTEKNNLSKKDTQGKSPSLHRIFSIGEDRAGNIWFGTVDYGIWRYDGKTLTNFSSEDGLESKHIWAIYEDKRGELWVAGASPSSVSKFNGISFDRVF